MNCATPFDIPFFLGGRPRTSLWSSWTRDGTLSRDRAFISLYIQKVHLVRISSWSSSQEHGSIKQTLWSSLFSTILDMSSFRARLALLCCTALPRLQWWQCCSCLCSLFSYIDYNIFSVFVPCLWPFLSFPSPVIGGSAPSKTEVARLAMSWAWSGDCAHHCDPSENQLFSLMFK